MNDLTRKDKGKKTTIIWMAAAGIVGILVLWRVAGGGGAERASDQPLAAATGANASATASAAPTPEPTRAAPAKAPSIQPRGEPENLPGDWVDRPATTEKARVNVLALHGRGDTAAHFSHLGREFPASFAWRFLEGPLPFSSGRRWFDSAALRANRFDLNPVFAQLRAHVQAMPQPVVLLGFSQGCMTLLRIQAEAPLNVMGVVCIGGNLLGEVAFAKGPKPPMLFVTGALDRVVAAQDVRASIQRFENEGFATEFIEHPGGHTIPNAEIGRIADWMLRR